MSGPAGVGASISHPLLGTFAGLIMVVVISTMFVTAEYRRGMMRTTLAAIRHLEEAVTGADGIPIGYATLVVVYIGLASITAVMLRRLARKPLEA